MKKQILTTAVILLTTVSPAFAATHMPNPMMAEINQDCSGGGALDQFQCVQEKLKALESQMNDLVKQADSKIKSMRGDEGTQELKERFQSAQKSWVTYRDETCMHDYYTKAPDHPPSLSLDISVCKYLKTKERIAEIKKTYLNQGE